MKTGKNNWKEPRDKIKYVNVKVQLKRININTHSQGGSFQILSDPILYLTLYIYNMR